MAVESESKMLIILDQPGDNWSYEITKFDLNPHLPSSASRNNKTRSSSQNRPPPPSLSRCSSLNKQKNRPPPPPGFALSVCSSLSKKKNRHPSPSLSRCSRRHHLTLGRFGRFIRVRRHRPPLLLPDPLPVPCQDNFTCALGAGVAVLGCKVYVIGGMIPGGRDPLHRGVYMIDASSDSPEMVKFSCELNFGKMSPIVCTIGTMIYVLPASFFSGKFECFDPESNSCTVLPSPLYDMEAPGESSGFEKIKMENLICSRYSDGVRVRSHAVVGSNLVICIDYGAGVFTFDTTRPDRGWRRIKILLILQNGEPPHVLNFLPFDHVCSIPIRDDLIFSSPRDDSFDNSFDRELDPHIRNSFKLNINNEDSYVCSFHNVAQLSDPECEFVKVSIHLVTGLEITKRKLKTEYDFEYIQFVKNPRTLGDGIVLVSKDASDQYGFEIFQVGRAFNSDDKDHHYKASKISDARFKTRVSIFDSLMIPLLIKG